MHLFYVPHIATSQTLSEEESRHAIRVLRLASGDKIQLVDGVGGFYEAVITNPHPKHCEYEILEEINDFGKRDFRIHIAIAPTKNIDRFEWFVEKCTEIGIDEITPIICRFSERKVIKSERIEKIIVSSSKQSYKAFFPKLNPVSSFNEFIKNNPATQKFIAHCYEHEKVMFHQAIKTNNDYIVLIGPEGDFSLEEIEMAIKNNYTPISLGNSRLRTETAGVVACHTINLKNETRSTE